MRTVILLLAATIGFGQNGVPITQAERIRWAALAAVGAPSLAAGVLTRAGSTGLNKPPEYGTHWGGYGKRQALRLTGTTTSALMEVELGALWGEDPRYRRATVTSPSGRVWHAGKTRSSLMTATVTPCRPTPASSRCRPAM